MFHPSHNVTTTNAELESHFLIFKIISLCWSLYCRKLYFLSNTEWATRDVSMRHSAHILIYYSEIFLPNFSQVWNAFVSPGHFLKWNNFCHISGVIQQYLGLCTSTPLGNSHKFPLNRRTYTTVLVSWLGKQKEVSIHTGSSLTLFLHSDPTIRSHSIGYMWVALKK